MPEAAAPSGGAAAPAAAPASAPSGGAAPTGQSAGSSAANAQTPQGGQQTSQPTRAPVMIKHRAQIGDAEHEIELDIAEHLAAQRFKFKADGQDHDLSWEEVQQRLPMSQAAYKRMSQAAEATKKAEATQKENQEWRARVEQTLRNPDAVLGLVERALGGREQALRAVEKYVAAHLAEQKLTPEQRAARDAEAQRRQQLDQNGRKLSEREKALQAREEAIAKAESDRLTAQFTEQWPKALQAEGVPQTKQTMRMMAKIKSDAYKAGYDMPDAEAAREVKAEMQAFVSGLDAATLAQVAPNATQQLERQRIEQLNATQPGRVAQRSQQQAARAKPNDPKPEETWEEMHERITRQSDQAYHDARLRAQRG